MLNSLFGKFAQWVDTQVALVSDDDEMRAITDNFDNEIKSVLSVGSKLRVEYSIKDGIELDKSTPPFYSPIIAGEEMELFKYCASCLHLF